MGAAGWRVAIASAIGTSHLQSATPCQDHAAYAFVDNADGPVLALVVCDGAGSARYSDVGAELAAQELIRLVRTHLNAGGSLPALSRAMAATWVRRIAMLIAERADQEEHDPRDYACTLLCAFISPDAAAFLQIGDGAIVVSHGEADGWCYLFWPQHGEFANTTNFVVSPNATEVMEFEVAARRIDEIALFTDGIENLVLHQASRSVHEPFFNQMFPPVRSSRADGLDDALSDGLKRYLSAPAICEKTDDDKTLILASRVRQHSSALPPGKDAGASGPEPCPHETAPICPT
jgi:hypothetical protein